MGNKDLELNKYINTYLVSYGYNSPKYRQGDQLLREDELPYLKEAFPKAEIKFFNKQTKAEFLRYRSVVYFDKQHFIDMEKEAKVNYEDRGLKNKEIEEREQEKRRKKGKYGSDWLDAYKSNRHFTGHNYIERTSIHKLCRFFGIASIAKQSKHTTPQDITDFKWYDTEVNRGLKYILRQEYESPFLSASLPDYAKENKKLTLKYKLFLLLVFILTLPYGIANTINYLFRTGKHHSRKGRENRYLRYDRHYQKTRFIPILLERLLTWLVLPSILVFSISFVTIGFVENDIKNLVINYAIVIPLSLFISYKIMKSVKYANIVSSIPLFEIETISFQPETLASSFTLHYKNSFRFFNPLVYKLYCIGYGYEVPLTILRTQPVLFYENYNLQKVDLSRAYAEDTSLYHVFGK